MKKIAIHSVPRSGSSWLGEIVNSSPLINYSFQPLFSYRFKSYLSDKSSRENIDDFFSLIGKTSDDFIRQTNDRESGKKPLFSKGKEYKAIAYKEVRYHYILDNLIQRGGDVKVLALVRDPRAVISSWYCAPREFRKDLGWSLENELLNAESKNQGRKEEYFGLMAWIETTKQFERLNRLYSNKVNLVRYSDLIKDPVEKSKELFSFIDIPYSKQTNSFLINERESLGTYSVFKKKKCDDAWKNVLPRNIVDSIEALVKESDLEHYLEE